jgi:hypothetical protein
MRRSVTVPFAAAIVLALAVPVFAGGFYVQFGNPDASTEAKAHNAVLTVKSAGCHEPEKATITGTAIGMVDGRRQSLPLKLVPLSEPGMYALTQQWPAQGRWVLQFVATDNDRVTSALVAVGPSGIERQTAKYMPGRQPDAEEVAALLGKVTTAKVTAK